jgi:hypothetical protein
MRVNSCKRVIPGENAVYQEPIDIPDNLFSFQHRFAPGPNVIKLFLSVNY